MFNWAVVYGFGGFPIVLRIMVWFGGHNFLLICLLVGCVVGFAVGLVGIDFGYGCVECFGFVICLLVLV